MSGPFARRELLILNQYIVEKARFTVSLVEGTTSTGFVAPLVTQARYLHQRGGVVGTSQKRENLKILRQPKSPKTKKRHKAMVNPPRK
ncbi:hypothetical protein ACOSQ2_021388 [Xanthoceras sorbifolium]